MKKCMYSLWATLCLFAGTVNAQRQTPQSLVFRLRVPGGSAQVFAYNVAASFGAFNFSLTDNNANKSPYEIGIGMNGEIAVISTAATGDQLYSCLNRGTVWANANTARKRVDVTSNGVVLSIDAAGVLYRDGSNFSGGRSWLDVGAGPTRYVWAVTTSNTIYRRDTATNTLVQVTGASAQRVDAGPNNTAVIVNTANQVVLYNGTSWTNLGKPNNTNVNDVAIGPDGTPWAIAGNLIYSYTSGAWLKDAGAPTGQQLYNISVGPDNQPIATGYFSNGSVPLPKNNAFKRLSTGKYTTLDVDAVSSTIVFYNIPTGEYPGTQTPVSGWSIADLYQYGGGPNSTTNQIAGSAYMDIDSTEASVVEVVNVNCTPALTAIGTICGSGYKENFGTGANPYGNALGCGETTQLFMNTSGSSIEDGQYSIVSNVSTGGHGGWINGTDHTGNGNMMILNADYTPGVFFNRTFNGLAIGASYDFSSWIANILKASVGGIPVNVTFRVTDPATGDVVAETSTGDIANSNTLTWKRYALTFIASASTLKFQLVNNSPGGDGNDLVLDDITVNVSSDRGDAPESYGTSSLTNGPCHIATPATLRMGTLLDSEPDGIASAKADGDNLDGTNDDDGIGSFPVLQTTATAYSVSVAVSNNIGKAATLRGWMDWNNNGTFEAGESVAVPVADGFTGTKTLTWSGLSITPAAYTFGRFRLTSGTITANDFTGTAPDGEVEDYRIPIINSSQPLPVKLTYFKGECNNAVTTFTWLSSMESNMSGYDLEASTDAITWKSVQQIATAGADHIYNGKADINAGPYYRLNAHDNNGGQTYSATLRLNCTEEPQEEKLILYPNPNTGLFNIGFTAGKAHTVKIVIINSRGEHVWTLNTTAAIGNNVYQCSVPTIPKGLYYIALTDENGSRHSVAFRKDY